MPALPSPDTSLFGPGVMPKLPTENVLGTPEGSPAPSLPSARIEEDEDSTASAGSALMAVRQARRPVSAAPRATGIGAVAALQSYSKYGRRVRTKSARPRLGTATVAASAREPALGAAAPRVYG